MRLLAFSVVLLLPVALLADSRDIYTRMSTTAFWDAHLRGDEKAKIWLTRQFASTLGKDGTFEVKAK